MNQTSQPDYQVRAATEADVAAILRIYNHHVLHSTATFDTTPETPESRLGWFRRHGSRFHPVLVLELDGEIRGWASLSEWSTRCAYERTVENSIYIDEPFQGRGAGKVLLQALIDAGGRAGVRTIIARIATTQTASLRLHERLGFENVGTMRQVGEKFGKLLDVCVMQYIYEPQAPRGG